MLMCNFDNKKRRPKRKNKSTFPRDRSTKYGCLTGVGVEERREIPVYLNIKYCMKLFTLYFEDIIIKANLLFL